MNFHKRLFVSDNIENQQEIINKLNDSTAVFNLYLVTVSKKSKSLFEIMESGEYFKEINKDKDYIIIGLAYGRRDSVETVEKIIKWWLNGRDNLNGLKNYFLR